MITLDGHLERITYYNEENHYTIAKLNTGPTQHPVTIIGYMPAVSPGEALKITGSWETHPTFGEQLRVASFEVTLPASANGIRNYLKSGIIKGIGPAMAERLVEHFQENTLDVIEKAPAKLLEVSGIGKAKAALITGAWKNHHAVRGLMHVLQKHGIAASYSAKILKTYGTEAENVIYGNPYRLSVDIPGIDFRVSDTIALSMGVAEDDPNRIKAGILYLMALYASEGHTLAHREQLLDRCTKMLGVGNGLVAGALESLDRLKAMLTISVTSPGLDPEQMMMEVLKKLAIKLSSEQIIVLEEILSHRVAIITGGPGTGKTTLIRSITAIFESLGEKILLAAPTGRAARRLSEVTRRKASTLHKLLGYNLTTGNFDKNQDNPLETHALIVDETSMVDTELMFHLLKALPMTSVLIMVGDIFQLPSVGPGNVLSDMIGSEIIRTFELKKIFRQAQESPIVINAHKIRRGESPDLTEAEQTQDLSEFYFIEQHNPDTVVKTVVELCTHRIPRRYHFDNVKEIQVLTPMHRGAVGTINLNKVLQKVLNSSNDTEETKGIQFRPDDKVMHLKNNYQKEVFNGDIGAVTSVDRGKKQLWVDYDGREVCYDFAELDELTLAYAISVHKSQGSEYPAVIVPIMTQHYALLQRNLLYTAITRGKKLVILIGTKKAFDIALKNDKPQQRLTGLANRLKENPKAEF
ncbi:MAG: AAA family ATPase [Deltaproteobacteria bacterium]|nr:AAA family ATPase [Deltaproteobacteria bacterium]